MSDGLLNEEMNKGNMLVDNKGMVVEVDLGIKGRIEKKKRRLIEEIIYGLIKRDYMRVEEVNLEEGYVN